jgi:hypothetical protein
LQCIAKEECEKAQLLKLMAMMRKKIFDDPYGSINFLESKVKTNHDIFVFENKSEKENIQIKKPLCRKQDLFYQDTRMIKLASLWYIAHPAECVSVFFVLDDIYRNSDTMRRRRLTYRSHCLLIWAYMGNPTKFTH